MTDCCVCIYVCMCVCVCLCVQSWYGRPFFLSFFHNVKMANEKKVVIINRKKKRLFFETKRRRTADIHYTYLYLPSCLPTVVVVEQYAGITDCSRSPVTSSLIREWNILRSRNYTDGRLAARNKLVRCRGKSIWADNLSDAMMRCVITCAADSRSCRNQIKYPSVKHARDRR